MGLLASSIVVLPPLSSKAFIRYLVFEPFLNLIPVWFLSQHDCTCPCLCILYDSFLISIWRGPESSFLLRAFCTCWDGFGITLINTAPFSNRWISSPLLYAKSVVPHHFWRAGCIPCLKGSEGCTRPAGWAPAARPPAASLQRWSCLVRRLLSFLCASPKCLLGNSCLCLAPDLCQLFSCVLSRVSKTRQENEGLYRLSWTKSVSLTLSQTVTRRG